MKRLALVAVAVLAVAACGKKDEAVTDTTMMPGAAAMTDTSMRMTDTSMRMNDTSMMRDTLMKRTTDTMIPAQKTTTVTRP